jgi:predicted AAA+ superfamily ATPase
VLSITAQEDSARYIKSDIIDKVLLRDLPSIYGIADVQELNALFTTIAIVPNKAARIDGLVKYTLNLVARLNVFALTSTR